MLTYKTKTNQPQHRKEKNFETLFFTREKKNLSSTDTTAPDEGQSTYGNNEGGTSRPQKVRRVRAFVRATRRNSYTSAWVSDVTAAIFGFVLLHLPISPHYFRPLPQLEGAGEFPFLRDAIIASFRDAMLIWEKYSVKKGWQ